MKIIVVASLAYSLVNFRQHLLLDLVAKGHEVLACAPDRDDRVVAKLDAMGVTFHRIPMNPTGTNPVGDFRTLFSLWRLFRRERPEMVLAYTQKPIIYSGIAARLASGRIRFCAMVTGLGRAFSSRPDRAHRLLRRFVALLYRLGLARASWIFTFNAQDEADLYAFRMIGAQRRVQRLPGSGVDLDHFACQPLPGGPPVFLLMARLLHEKGIGEFVEAAVKVKQAFPAARFQLLGHFDTGTDAISRVAVDQWVKTGAIEFLGDTTDVRPHLALATAVVLPSYYREGLPRSILEGMAVGRAIVTTDLPGCRDAVREGVTGFLVPPRDSDALARALMRFCAEPELAAQMGRRSRALAEERFDAREVSRTVVATLLPQTGEQRILSGKSLGDRRKLELLLALSLCVLLWPAAMITAGLVALAMGRPVLFVQWRAGRNVRPFRMIKFRTMTDLRAADGLLLPDAERLGTMGRLLRRLRVDELPELWNVLRGDMAIIGPRPLLPGTLANMGEAGRRRCAVRPGLTGWAQVNGNALLSDRDKLALDLWYIDNRSLWLDLRILWRTLATIVMGERVNAPELRKIYACAPDRRG
jgi:lipopolysaccharide/colanic/teichoic acid biosynthesis glycosyltransferase